MYGMNNITFTDVHMQKLSATLRTQMTNIVGSTQIFDITKYVRANSV
jgi:hypothetical protein